MGLFRFIYFIINILIMRKYFILGLILLSTISTLAQSLTLKTPLNDEIEETSGLIRINNRLITHNDSGSEASLYEIDSLNGEVLRRVKISNAQNTDWEDITKDSLYIYIGDFGNNKGTRTDLKIYKIAINDYLNNDSVTADSISFEYSDQTDFSPSFFATNFDAEALISYEDSLYIFTKNWGNKWSKVYALPKTPGHYSTTARDSIFCNGFITGADYNTYNESIMLTGYTLNSNFIIKLSHWENNFFTKGNINRYEITPPDNTSKQIESIVSIDANQYYMTSESINDIPASLMLLTTDFSQINESSSKNHISIYPNPCHNRAYINLNKHNVKKVQLYNNQAVLVLESPCFPIDIRHLNQGIYWFKIYLNKPFRIINRKLIKI